MGYLKPLPKRVPRGQRFGENPGLGPNPAGGHNGDDYKSWVGEPIYAAGDGEVIHAGTFDTTYADNFGWNLNFGGNMVVLNLDGATAPYVEYGHMDRIYVSAGQRVRRGQVIGTTGATDGGTGVISGPHLHVGCLPPNFNLNTNTYGRVNPDVYLTDYPDETGSSLSYASESITPVQEDTFMAALTEEEQRRILAAADRINYVVDDPKAKVLTTNHIDAVATSAASKVLNTPIARGGVGAELGAGTNLGAVVAWFDSAILGLAGAINSQAAAAGATPEQVIDAVKQALAAGVVKVDVSVQGGAK